MQIAQGLHHNQSQPDKERRVGLGQKAFDSPAAGEKGLLQNIVGIHPDEKPAVHAETDHPPQSGSVQPEKLAQNLLISLAQARKKCDFSCFQRMIDRHGSRLPTAERESKISKPATVRLGRGFQA
jgi:hypothetical protein